MTYQGIENITLINNTITMNSLNHSKCASDFLKRLRECINRGWDHIVIKCSDTAIFPNACLPICGIIQHYSSNGISFEFDFPNNHYLSSCGFAEPFNILASELKNIDNPFDKIFRFERYDQVAELTQSFINAISHQIVCEPGVLDGLCWCINEVMDNVITHSQSNCGYIMAQLHPASKHIAFCIYDSGIGIYNTLKNSKHRPHTEIDSLSLAIQEGVGDGKGQGNGLFGLYQVVHLNHGRLTLTSGSSSIMLQDNGEMHKFNQLPYISQAVKGTTVDFQLDLSKEISLTDAFKSIGGYECFDARIDDMLSESDEYIHYDVFSNSEGTATRESGFHLRNDIINTLRREKRVIILDFGSVQTVSSSFIDELIAKLVLSLGFITFNSRIRVKGMNETVRFLCERSLYMRIHSEWIESER